MHPYSYPKSHRLLNIVIEAGIGAIDSMILLPWRTLIEILSPSSIWQNFRPSMSAEREASTEVSSNVISCVHRMIQIYEVPLHDLLLYVLVESFEPLGSNLFHGSSPTSCIFHSLLLLRLPVPFYSPNSNTCTARWVATAHQKFDRLPVTQGIRFCSSLLSKCRTRTGKTPKFLRSPV